MNRKVLVKLFISIGLMSYLICKTDISELLRSLSKINLFLLVVIYSTFIPAALLSTYKWMILLRAQNIMFPGFTKLWGLYYVGSFFNNFLPTEVGGDIVRSYIVGKANNKQIESLSAVAVERITGLVAVILYGTVGVLINWKLAMELNLKYIMLGSFFLIIILFCFFFNRRFVKWIKEFFIFKKLDRIILKISRIYESFCLYKNNAPTLCNIIIISIIFQLYAISYTYGLLITIDARLPFDYLILVVPAITLVGIIPISINGIGLREGAFVLFLSQIGLLNHQAMLLALLYRGGTMLPSLIGGLIYTFSNTLKREAISASK